MRGHGLIFDFQFTFGGFFQIGQDALANFNVVAGVFAIAQGVGKRAGRITNAHGDNAGSLDFTQGIGALGKNTASGKQGNGECNKFEFHEISCNG